VREMIGAAPSSTQIMLCKIINYCFDIGKKGDLIVNANLGR
jgi:hypothetical protein